MFPLLDSNLPPTPAHPEMANFSETEEEWWIENPERYTSFEKLPLKAKWLARCVEKESHSKRLLEVFTNGQTHLLPGNYTAPLMLLTMQELSCMAESFSPAANHNKQTQLWRNIHFTWRLRESILIAPELHQTRNKGDRVHCLLERWIIRLVHGFTNFKSKSQEGTDELSTLYSAYHEGRKLEQGEAQPKFNF